MEPIKEPVIEGKKEPQQEGKQDNEYIKNVKDYLAINKEDPDVVELVSEMSKLNSTSVSEWLETEEGGKYIQPLFDRKVSHGINTYKENQFAQAVKAQVDEEISKINPEESPQDIRIRDLEKKSHEQERARKRAEHTSVAVRYLSEKGLNVGELINRMVCESEEDTRMAIDQLTTIVNLESQKAVNKILSQNSKVPKIGEEEDPIFAGFPQLQAYLKKHPGAETWERVGKPQWEKLAAKHNGG